MILYRGVDIDTVRDRFFRFVDVSDLTGCWPWTGALAKGYGQFQLASRITVRAHRLAWLYVYETIDDALTIDHLCKNRACTRWTHLEQVPRGENARRGLALTTTCKAGLHPWVEDNIVRRPSRTRGECRQCARERQRERASR